MQQISETVFTLEGGEPIPPSGFEDFVKIALMGTSDMGPAQNGDWQSKFAQGVAAITSTEPNKGIIMYRGMKFLLMNCKTMGYSNPMMTYDNPEFVTKISNDLNYSQAADAIFFNFLKSSQSVTPLVEYSLVAGTGKCVVRCPNEYVNYGLVRIIAERYQVPLLPGATTSVLSVLQTMWGFIPAFQEVQKFRMPE